MTDDPEAQPVADGTSGAGARRVGAPAADGGTLVADGPTVAALEAAEGSWGTLARQVATVARLEFRLAVRNRWAVALTGLLGLFALLIVAFGGTSLGPARVDAVVVSLASLATYLVPLAALAFGFDAVVGAEEEGWLGVLFALPVPRWAVVLGAYLGRAATLTAATAVGFGAAGVLLVVEAGPASAGAYAVVLLGAVGLGLAALALAVLVSAVAPEKTHALGLVLLVWVWLVLVHDLVALGAVAALGPPPAALSALVLSNPATVFRVLVLSSVGATGGGFGAIYADVGLSTPVLAAALVAWSVVPTWLAGRLVRRRGV